SQPECKHILHTPTQRVTLVAAIDDVVQSKSKAPASVVESVVFLEAVKRSGGAVLHAAFVRLLGRFRNGELGTGDVVGEVKTLFAGRPDLVRGFAVFLPE
ncbi:hypothetical protein BCR33DRAFT_761095, partial [Rhizoclosmatium globosum]